MDEFRQSLKSNNIQFVRVHWCDNANIVRTKAFHVGTLDSFFKDGVGLSVAQQAVPVMYDVPVLSTGLGPVGEVRLIPDWSTLTQLPYNPSHASVIGDMYLDSSPWSYCPRDYLKRMITKLSDLGLELQIGFENEFYVLNPEEDMTPVDTSLFSSVSGLDQSRDVLADITNHLLAQGIDITLLHSEAGNGQFELSLGYGNVLEKVDDQITFRNTLKATAHEHGLVATMMPKPLEKQSGVGTHLHMSLWENGVNITPNKDDNQLISDTTSQFIAGVLSNLPALMAVTTPSTNSYKRIQPRMWSGAYQVWGYDNREAAIRVPVSPKAKGITNIELKVIDGSANPYLAVASVIASGLDGIDNELSLPKPIDVDPGALTTEELEKENIHKLPESLVEALNNLEQNTAITEAMGDDLFTSYLAVKETEWEAMNQLSHQKEFDMLVDKF